MIHDDALSPSDGLRRIAASKLQPYGHPLAPEQREASAALLADLYATGLRRGITPETWAAFAGLDIECVDAIRWRDRPNRSSTRAEHGRSAGADRDPCRSSAREQEGQGR